MQTTASYSKYSRVMLYFGQISTTDSQNGDIWGTFCECRFWSVAFEKNVMISTNDHAWWRHHIETFSALLAICAGNSPITAEFPAQRPVTQSFDVFFDLRLNKRLSKQSWGWWFETLSSPLWRHCNGELLFHISINPVDIGRIITTQCSHCLFSQTRSPFYWHGLTLIPAWICNHMSSEEWNEITCPLPNFNGCVVDVWEWTSDFIPYFIIGESTHWGTEMTYILRTIFSNGD